jgi:hypothetical protein
MQQKLFGTYDRMDVRRTYGQTDTFIFPSFSGGGIQMQSVDSYQTNTGLYSTGANSSLQNTKVY